MRNTFAVPLGVGPKGLTRPDDAIKSERYSCPACGGLLTLRKGQKMRAHFAHRAGTDCSSESVEHWIAKMLIADAVRDGGVQIVTRCEAELGGCSQLKAFAIPDGLEPAIEHRLPSGHVADVALLDDDGVRFVVEVVVTHRVSEDKSAAIGPFIELWAADVMTTPKTWRRGVRGLRWSFREVLCGQCKAKHARSTQARARETARVAQARKEESARLAQARSAWAKFGVERARDAYALEMAILKHYGAKSRAEPVAMQCPQCGEATVVYVGRPTPCLACGVVHEIWSVGDVPDRAQAAQAFDDMQQRNAGPRGRSAASV